MRHFELPLIASLVLVGAGRADDSAAARSLLDEAIRAQGGEAVLAKSPVTTIKTEGIFHGYERTPVFFFTGEATQQTDHYRSTLDGDMQKQKFRLVNVFDGKQGWIKTVGDGKQFTQDCTPAQLAEFRESGYVNWISSLVPLRDSIFTLVITGEQKDRDQTVVGIRVTSAGHRDVTLFFDKESRLLVKTETRATAGTGSKAKSRLY
jgi:hypothetical protein